MVNICPVFCLFFPILISRLHLLAEEGPREQMSGKDRGDSKHLLSGRAALAVRIRRDRRWTEKKRVR